MQINEDYKMVLRAAAIGPTFFRDIPNVWRSGVFAGHINKRWLKRGLWKLTMSAAGRAFYDGYVKEANDGK